MHELLNSKKINKDIPIPLYYQLKEFLLEHINQAKPHTTIPTEDELCDMFEISRTTVRHALQELVNEGYLKREKGKGTTIIPPKIERDLSLMYASFNDSVNSLGLNPKTDVLSFETIVASSSIAETLQLKSGDGLLKLIRLRSVDGKPALIATTYIPADIYGLHSLLDEDLSSNSLYDTLNTKYNQVITSIKRTIEIRLAGEWEAKYLKVKVGSPLQYVETIAKNSEKIPIEFSQSYYRYYMSKFVFEFTKR